MNVWLIFSLIAFVMNIISARFNHVLIAFLSVIFEPFGIRCMPGNIIFFVIRFIMKLLENINAFIVEFICIG